MKRTFHVAVPVLSVFAWFGLLTTATALSDIRAAGSRPLLTSEEIVTKLVDRNLQRARALSGYQGTRVYRLEYRGFPGSRSAEIVVDVEYRSPGTKEFRIRSEKGSKLVIDRVFKRVMQTEKEALSEENQRRVALNQDNYRFTLAGSETTPTGTSYILSVEPRTDNKLLYRGRIWVDAEDFAVVRIEATPAKNPSFWTKDTKIEQVYSKVGNFWLPASNRSSSDVRLGGHANFVIEYKDYQISGQSVVGVSNEPGGHP
jgi:outer membrane lipoprotein-sorting protein